LAHALANCAVLTVYPPTVSEPGEPAKGDSPIDTYHSFSTERNHQAFTAPGLYRIRTNCTENALNRAETELRSDFIGT
jgi:hypothetical protein